MGVLADVALPEVEKVHVVVRRLAPLDLDQNSGLAERQEVVGPQRPVELASEQPLGLVREAERSRVREEHGLYAGARQARLVGRMDGGDDFDRGEMVVERIGDSCHRLILGGPDNPRLREVCPFHGMSSADRT